MRRCCSNEGTTPSVIPKTEREIGYPMQFFVLNSNLKTVFAGGPPGTRKRTPNMVKIANCRFKMLSYDILRCKNKEK